MTGSGSSKDTMHSNQGSCDGKPLHKFAERVPAIKRTRSIEDDQEANKHRLRIVYCVDKMMKYPSSLQNIANHAISIEINVNENATDATTKKSKHLEQLFEKNRQDWFRVGKEILHCEVFWKSNGYSNQP